MAKAKKRPQKKTVLPASSSRAKTPSPSPRTRASSSRARTPTPSSRARPPTSSPRARASSSRAKTPTPSPRARPQTPFSRTGASSSRAGTATLSFPNSGPSALSTEVRASKSSSTGRAFTLSARESASRLPARKKASTSSASSPKKVQRKSRHLNYYVGNKMFSVPVATLQFIKKMQTSTKLCVPFAPFVRLLKEVFQQFGEYRLQAAAIEALQEAAEDFLVYFFEDGMLCAHHAKRVTVRPPDVKLPFYLRREISYY